MEREIRLNGVELENNIIYDHHIIMKKIEFCIIITVLFIISIIFGGLIAYILVVNLLY
jgi:hypothetical protein